MLKGFIAGFLVGLVTLPLALAAVGHFLRLEDPLARADVIVAVSGDTGARAETAVALWREGYAPLILFAGGSLDPDSPASAELMKRQAMREGVPDERILVEPSSATTAENAREVAAIMREHGLRTAILVTSPYHQRRAAIHFGRAFEGTDMRFRNYPARDGAWDPNLWWVRESSRTLTLLELAKLGVELVDPSDRRVTLAGRTP